MITMAVMQKLYSVIGVIVVFNILAFEKCSAQFCIPPTCSASTPYGYFIEQISNTSSRVYLGGLFDIHKSGSSSYSCGEMRASGIQSFEAFMWAIRTFKTRYPNILREVDLGGITFDTCSDVHRTLQQVLNFETCNIAFGNPTVTPSSVLSYIGVEDSEHTAEIGQMLSKMSKTLITHAAKGSVLSKTDNFPYLLRTIPSDTDDISAVLMVLKTMNWKHVQVVYTEDRVEKVAFNSFRETAEAEDVCIVNSIVLPTGASDDVYDQAVMSLLRNRTTRAVIIFASPANTYKLIDAAKRNSQTRGVFTWIVRTSLGVQRTDSNEFKNTALGSIVIELDNNVSGLEDFKEYFLNLRPENSTHNEWFHEYWENVFECYLPGRPQRYTVRCDVSQQSLRGRVDIDVAAPFAIRAVDAAFMGIESAWKTRCPPGATKPCANFNNDDKKWDIVFNSIKQINRNELHFKSGIHTGDIAQSLHFITNYRKADILSNCQDTFCFERVGYRRITKGNATEMLTSGGLRIYDSSGEIANNPQSICSQPCTQCPDRTSKASVISTTPLSTAVNGIDSTTTSKTKIDIYEPQIGESKSAAPLEMREGRWVFALIILAGLGLLLVIIFEIYIMSKIIGAPIVKHWRTMWLGQLLLLAIFLCYLVLFAFVPAPTVASCAIIRFGVGTGYAMCFAILLVKLMIILSSKTVGYLKGIYQVLMFIFAWGIQVVVDVEWLILREPGVQSLNSTGTERLVCVTPFYTHVQSLVYVMFLIVITTILAMRTHGIITNHREGIFIGLCSGFSIPVWVVWIVIGMLNPNEDYQDPCLAFGLFITATLLLFIMFLPKVRQLNSMGVEGIYAEDDLVDGSVIHGNAIHGNLAPGSIIYSPPAYKSDALYLKHPSASVHSAPPVYATLPRRTDSVQHSTRVLRTTNDLSGRPVPDMKHAHSELNYPTTRSSKYQVSGSRNGTLNRPRSLQDLGSL